MEHMGAFPCFTIFIKSNNFCDFLFISQNDSTLFRKRSTFEGKNLLLCEQILTLKVKSPLKWETKMQNGRVVSPENIPIHIKNWDRHS